MQKWLVYLGQPVEISPLVWFRMGVALLVALHVLVNFRKIAAYFTSSPFYIPYEWTPWLHPPNRRWKVLLLCILLFVFSLLLAAGVLPFFSALACFLLYSAMVLWDKALYNNHYYLIALLLFVFAAVDWSKETVPYWQLLLFKLQFLLVYTYAGINKIQRDWLIRAQPTWHALKAFEGTTKPSLYLYHYCPTEKMARIARFLLRRKSAAYLINFSGLLFDLVIIPLLWWEKTQLYALPFYLFFQLFNQWFLSIEIFPLVNLLALVLFLDADKRASSTLAASGLSGESLMFFTGYLLLQIALPLRRLIRSWVKGVDLMSDHSWYFSWTMRLRSAIGTTIYRILDRKSGEVLARVQPSQFLLPRQAAFVSRSPHAAIQFAKWLEKELRKQGWSDFAMHLACTIDINERGRKCMIDPDVDFTKERVKLFGSYSWYWEKEKN